MDVLIRFGFSINEIQSMMDNNPSLESIPDKDIYLFIEILNKVGCTDEMVKNIFLCNPFCISRNIQEN